MELEKLKLALGRICQNIGGDWLLLGGSLVRFDVDPTRGTHDLDIVQIPIRLDAISRTALVLEMKALGLSPEQVNSAVSFFLPEPGLWETHVVELASYPAGRLFRPTLTLFAYLKLQRATPIDVEDVVKARNKWGAAEFDAAAFGQWTKDAHMMEHAQRLGLF